jgi:glycosyltransferase involved in cell wall biosynthesis
MLDSDGRSVPADRQDDARRRLKVLHLILMLGETNGQYNEHCLPLIGERDLSISTYFVPRLTPPPEITMFAGDGTLRGFFRSLHRALDAERYDVIHAHAPQSGVLLLLAVLARRRSHRLRRSLVYTVQDSFYDYRLRDQAMMVVPLVTFHRVIFCSGSAYESLPRVLKWLVRGRWRVVQNGADIDRVDRAIAAASVDRPIDREDGRFTVLSVGRLDAVKDPFVVLDAFARLVDRDDDGRLVFIGGGRLATALEARVDRTGLQGRVTLRGLIPREQVFLASAEADVFVSTSRGEGLPVAVLEAMAAGCPVILSDIPPHRELAEDAGFIPFVTPGDVEGFAKEIKRYRAMTSDERREIGRRCRAHVSARFTLPIMRAGTDAVYMETARPAASHP